MQTITKQIGQIKQTYISFSPTLYSWKVGFVINADHSLGKVSWLKHEVQQLGTKLKKKEQIL